MTNKLTLGIDPGQTGAIAIIADGVPVGFIDMPTIPRKSSGEEIDCATLADRLRDILAAHPGARVRAALEQVNAMPSYGGAGVERRSMGATSAMRFGESFGAIKGVLGSLRISYEMVGAQAWKKKFGLIGTEKDVARTIAIQRYPEMASQLCRKKDIGRADALLIGTWCDLNAERDAA
jgi:crossover junction endodeoxyribonuclease RuvC